MGSKNFNDLPEENGIKKTFSPEDHRIDLSKNIPDPEPIFSISGVTLCSAGNIKTIKAKQKGAKTTLVSVFVTSNFLGSYLTITSHQKKQIAWIDSEQSINQIYKIARRTHRLCGIPEDKNNDALQIFFARELDLTQRWELFESLLESTENEIIILDVATDWVNDINDIGETKQAVDRILKGASIYKKLIICTIHENKNDKNATGHFGGSLQKKSEAVISLSKENGVFTVSATDTRHGDWPDFSFIFDPEGLPVGIDTPIKLSTSERNELERSANITAILSGVRLNYTELVERYIPRSGKAERTAKRHISNAIKSGHIRIQSDGRYILSKYSNEEN